MGMPQVFYSDNPSQLYLQTLAKLITEGEEVGPRGKLTKELHPVTTGFSNPLNRVTFLKGRTINPFFQLFESFWILCGRSDVEGLTPYNKSIAQFSDDGVYFNAPYGERLRFWGKNDSRDWIINPIDQLTDCYNKLKADENTRQAVAFIGNPHFDNSKYTLAGGKDIACNLNIKFKIRNGKLDITVDNRSNDLHWGLYGANLCQFSTIQEAMASWLDVPVGNYYQQSDSLHIYLDDYGYKLTDSILKAYGVNPDDISELPEVKQFTFKDEPRMSFSKIEFDRFISYYHQVIEPVLTSDVIYKDEPLWKQFLENLDTIEDEYLKLTFQACFVKQAHNRRNPDAIIAGMKEMKDSQWKVMCLRWLYPKFDKGSVLQAKFKSLYSHLEGDIKDYIERKGE